MSRGLIIVQYPQVGHSTPPLVELAKEREEKKNVYHFAGVTDTGNVLTGGKSSVSFRPWFMVVINFTEEH